MNRWLKGFLRFVCRLILVGGPLLALVAIAASFTVGPRNVAHGTVGLTLGLYVLLWSLLVGGVLALLLSIDDRLERLEAKG
jgi:uncharacterized SAM-binding protein YcdF (DUF218 family)